MSSVVDRAPDECGRGATAHSVALMGTVLVVVAHEAVQRALEREAAGEVSTAKDHAPVFLQDGALQALDEAVGPGMARLGPRVARGSAAARAAWASPRGAGRAATDSAPGESARGA